MTAKGSPGAIVRRALRPAARWVWPRALPALHFAERVVWGGPHRERLLRSLLIGHYRSVFRRQWTLVSPGGQPHWFDHRIGAADFALRSGSPYGYTRGFHATEVLREGDRLLDIGCGDGFFDRRFFAPKCGWIDAIDVEPGAIAHARIHNSGPNIAYHESDAVLDPFPAPAYDVVVWDGALGHFASETTDRVLAKVRDALRCDGVFVGSESLGVEGTDHLQFFMTLDDLGRVLGRHFPHVELRQTSYVIPDGTRRTEGYWRCAVEPPRLREVGWRAVEGAR